MKIIGVVDETTAFDLSSIKKRRSSASIRGLKHVGFRLAVGSTGTEELSAIPCRLDVDHAVLYLLPYS
jgi:hypothetical protein